MVDIWAILIDITTDHASIGLSKNQDVISIKYFSNQQSTMAEIHIFLEALLLENNRSLRDLSFVAVSSGPGSYTGLRIMYSTVKGICFVQDLPLIEVDTLLSWKKYFTKISNDPKIVPMMDARNSNVFTLDEDDNAVFIELNNEEKIKEFLKSREGFYIGSGAKILRDFVEADRIADTFLFDVKCMLSLAWDKYTKNEFSDIAYCEPHYLKPAHITISKKQLF